MTKKEKQKQDRIRRMTKMDSITKDLVNLAKELKSESIHELAFQVRVLNDTYNSR